MNQMILRVDQAGKIEDTTKDTILAYVSQESQYTIKIPKKIKQDIFNRCRKRYRRNITLRFFSYALYLLLKDADFSMIIIDDEYPGNGRDIKNMLSHKLKKDSIIFTNLGKRDLSHTVANQTFSGKLKPNRIITEIDINQIIPRRKRGMLKA